MSQPKFRYTWEQLTGLEPLTGDDEKIRCWILTAQAAAPSWSSADFFSPLLRDYLVRWGSLGCPFTSSRGHVCYRLAETLHPLDRRSCDLFTLDSKGSNLEAWMEEWVDLWGDSDKIPTITGQPPALQLRT